MWHRSMWQRYMWQRYMWQRYDKLKHTLLEPSDVSDARSILTAPSTQMIKTDLQIYLKNSYSVRRQKTSNFQWMRTRSRSAPGRISPIDFYSRSCIVLFLPDDRIGVTSRTNLPEGKGTPDRNGSSASSHLHGSVRP